MRSGRPSIAVRNYPRHYIRAVICHAQQVARNVDLFSRLVIQLHTQGQGIGLFLLTRTCFHSVSST